MPDFNAPRTQANAASADAAVLSGAHWLDTSRRVTGRWRERIDTTALDMGSHRHDLLAQLGTNVDDLDLTLDKAIGLGFEAHEDDPEVHAHLTAAWRRYLAGERKAVA